MRYGEAEIDSAEIDSTEIDSAEIEAEIVTVGDATTASPTVTTSPAAAASPTASPAAAAVTAVAGSGQGTILREYWTGIGGTSLQSLRKARGYPNAPNGSEQLTSFETYRTLEPDYGSRIRGYVHPPVTGDYRFYITSDDNSGLWLSTDETPDNAVYIAGVSKWSGLREWDRYGEQASGSIRLEAGKKYYIEALHKQGDGKDNLAVGWQRGEGAIEVIDGAFLSPFQP